MNSHRIRLSLAMVVAAVLPSCAGLFPTEATERLQHFAFEAPPEGELAPDFTLRTTGGESFTLTDVIGDKPVVLLLGSYTCPVFRYRRAWLRSLEQDFADRVKVVVVYTIEAHPVAAPSPYTGDEWDLSINWLAGVRNPQAGDFDQRRAAAVRAREEMGFASPLLVDRMDNEVWL